MAGPPPPGPDPNLTSGSPYVDAEYNPVGHDYGQVYRSRVVQLRQPWDGAGPLLLDPPDSGYWGHEIWTEAPATEEGGDQYKPAGTLVYAKRYNLTTNEIEEVGTLPTEPMHWLFSFHSLAFPPDGFPDYR